MKNILILMIVSGLFIACMVGTAMAADPKLDENLISGSQIVAPVGTPTTITINLIPDSTNGFTSDTRHEVYMHLDGAATGISVDLPTSDNYNSLTWYVSKEAAEYAAAHGGSYGKITQLSSTGTDAYCGNLRFIAGNKMSATVHTTKSTSSGNLMVEVDSSNYCGTYVTTDTDPIKVPEFPTVALPVAAVLGLLFIVGHKKEKL